MHETVSPFRTMAGLRWARAAIAVVALLCCTLAGCAQQAPQLPSRHPWKRHAPMAARQPVVDLNESPEFFVPRMHPSLQGLKSWRELGPSVRKSLEYVKSRPKNGVAVRRPGLHLTWGAMERTLTRLESILPYMDGDPSLLLRHFRWRPVRGGISYTGYHEPTVRASRTRRPGYEQAIYRKPPELDGILARGGRYHTRREIEEKQVLAGRGLELAWAADPVDTFFLEIQGSGRLRFEDGSEVIINYDAQNGHKYKSSGRIMREKNLLKRGDIHEQREWFRNNPHRVREILNDNPSYVFFRLHGPGPTGAMGHVVDPWVSLASDRSVIPLGCVVAYGVMLPEPDGKTPMRGLGLAQDVGGAIRDNRIDIFCGPDERADYVAAHLDARGPAWVLVLRDEPEFIDDPASHEFLPHVAEGPDGAASRARAGDRHEKARLKAKREKEAKRKAAEAEKAARRKDGKDAKAAATGRDAKKASGKDAKKAGASSKDAKNAKKPSGKDAKAPASARDARKASGKDAKKAGASSRDAKNAKKASGKDAKAPAAAKDARKPSGRDARAPATARDAKRPSGKDARAPVSARDAKKPSGKDAKDAKKASSK